MIKQLFETHIKVCDLEASMRFYEDVIGLELGTKDEDRRIAFYWIGGWAKTMLGLWEKSPHEIQRQHFAFEIEVDDMQPAISALHEKGVRTYDFFQVVTDVPSAFGWVPAISIYFRDPDGHELEYLAKLPGEPRPDFGIQPWPEWQAKYGAQR